MGIIGGIIMELFDKKAVVDRLGISMPTLNRLIAKNEIDVVKIGKAVRFSEEAITKFVRSRTVRSRKKPDSEGG